MIKPKDPLFLYKHWKWIRSLGVNISLKTGKIKSGFKGYNMPDYSTSDDYKCSDVIGTASGKKPILELKLPPGKTIAPAYNKGGYMLVDQSDFKTMGRKI
jgi:hypothetical protein